MVEHDIERVRSALAQPGVTRRFVAAVAGVSRNHLNKYEDADWNPHPRARRKLAGAADKIVQLLPNKKPSDAAPSRKE